MKSEEFASALRKQKVWIGSPVLLATDVYYYRECMRLGRGTPSDQTESYSSVG